MKTIIAGGRGYQLTQDDTSALHKLTITEVVSGGAAGADRGGEIFAKYNKIPIKVFPADWERHGAAAGPVRNKQMADYADAVVLFRGGRGTDSMYRIAKAAGIIIHDYRGPQQTK